MHLAWTSISMSLLYWWAQNWTQHSRCVSPVPSRGERPPLSNCWQHSSYCSPGDHWLSLLQEYVAHGQFVVHLDPQVIFCKAAFQTVGTQHILVHGVIIWTGWTSWGSCVPISPACQSPCGWEHNLLVLSGTPPCFVSSEDLLRVHSGPSSRSLMKMLSSIDPSVCSWDAPLETGLQMDFMLLITSLWAQEFSQFTVYVRQCLLI